MKCSDVEMRSRARRVGRSRVAASRISRQLSRWCASRAVKVGLSTSAKSSPVNFVWVRNPWGYDGGATTYGDANDGFVRLSWSDFARSMDAYIIN